MLASLSFRGLKKCLTDATTDMVLLNIQRPQLGRRTLSIRASGAELDDGKAEKILITLGQ